MKKNQYSNLLLDQTKDLIWAVDLHLFLVYANKAYLNLMKEVTGVEKELNTPILVEGFGEGYIEKWKSYYLRALSGEFFEIEEHFYNPDTKEIEYGHIAFSPIRDQRGEIQAVACRSTDITPVIRQKDHASRLMDASLDVFCTLNEAGKFVFVNAVSADHWGYHPEELVGRPYRDLVVEEDLEKTDLVVAEIMAGREFKSFSNRFRKKNGDIAYNLWSARWSHEAKLMYCVARDAKDKIEEEAEKELLSKISLSFNKEEEFIPAANHLCENLHAFGKFDLIELWCPNMEQTQIILMGRSTQNQDFYELEPSETSFQKNEGLQGKVWEKGKRLLWDEKLINKYFIRKKGASHLGLKAILGIPLTFNDELVGVLLIGTKRDSDYLEQRSSVLRRLDKFIGSEINRKRLENDLTNVFDAIPEILCITDFEGRFLKINSAGCTLLGYTTEEVLFHSLDEFTLNEDKGKFEQKIKGITKEASVFTFENRFLSRDGQVIWLSWNCNTALKERLVYASAKNITAEVQLRELNTQSASLAKIGSWEVDVEKNTVFWSKMVHQLHETNPDSFFPDLETALNFYREDFRPLVMRSIEKSITTGEGFDFEAVIITKELKERWVRAIGNVEIVNGKSKRIFGSFQDITDRKESEISLQASLKSLEDYKFALDQTAIITITDTKGIITSVNDQFCKISKYSREELIGNTHRIINSKYHSKSFFAELWGTIAKGKVFRAEIKNKAKDGSFYWVDSTIVPFLDENNKPFQYVAIRIDITAKKLANEKIIETLEEKHHILESIGDNFLTLNKDWIVTYWNKQSETFSGIKKEDILGKDIRAVYHDAIDKEFQKQYHKAMSTGKTINFEFHYTPYDKWVEVTVYPSDRGLSVYSRDISSRKEVDIQLLEANERFEIITRATNDAIWDYNIVKNTLFWGDGFKTLFGYDVEKITPTLETWTSHIHPDDIEQVQKTLSEALENKNVSTWSGEYRYEKADGTFAFVYDKGIIIRDQEGKAVRMLGAMTDFTQLKKQEKELLKINKSLNIYTKELERSNEELEQFAFITSHDLQEPLRMISSFMDQLKRKYSDKLDDKALQYIHFAMDGAKRMKQIILDLLLYSRANKPSEQFEEVNLNEITVEYTQLRRKLIAEKKGSVKFDTLPVLETYRAPITQIIHCLLDNALRYGKENVPPHIEIHAKEKETVWEFAVTDNGIGIDEQFHDKIFIIFQRLHNRNQHKGTGIGLSIAKRSVEFLGGEIWLESKVGEGSTFYFTIAKKITHKALIA